MPPNPPSRYQTNQLVKNALVRHYVDLTNLDFTTTGTTVYLNGTLKKDPRGDFSLSDLESLLREIVRIPGVRGLQVDLENWLVTYSGGGFELHKKTMRRASSGMGQTVHIGEQENIRNVLGDIPQDLDDDGITG